MEQNNHKITTSKVFLFKKAVLVSNVAYSEEEERSGLIRSRSTSMCLPHLADRVRSML